MTPDYTDTPDHQTPIGVDFDGRCSSCGTTANPPYTTVAAFPDPDSDDPRGRRRCHECFADRLRERTGLSRKPALVLALELVGYSHAQIGEVMGRSVTTVEDWAKEARDARGADARAGELEAVFQYL